MRRNKKGLTLFLSTLKSVLTFIKISPQTLVLFVVSHTACERATRTLFSAPKTSAEIDSLFECMTSHFTSLTCACFEEPSTRISFVVPLVSSYRQTCFQLFHRQGAQQEHQPWWGCCLWCHSPSRPDTSEIFFSTLPLFPSVSVLKPLERSCVILPFPLKI